MKIYQIVSMAAIVAVILFPSCSFETETGMQYITVLQDITDTHIDMPKPNKMLLELDIKKNSWTGTEFRYGFISNIEYNTEHVLRLPAENSWTGNEFSRKKKTEEFNVKLEKMLHSMKQEGRTSSVIFPVVIREVNRLANAKGDGRKSLYIFSDLTENSSGIHLDNRVWDRHDIGIANKTWQRMENTYGISLAEDLSGLDIHLFYRARSTSDSKRFSGFSNMYKRFLESKGASVTISANL